MTTLEKLEELVYVGLKESSAQMDRLSLETNRLNRETNARMDQSSRETDARIEKLNEETRAELKKLSREIGKITNSLGRFVEDMVEPAIIRIFNERGIPITRSSPRVKSPLRRIEYDIIAENGDYIVVVSVKMTLDNDDVKTFIEERLSIIKEVFPTFADKKVIGVVAGASIIKQAEVYAMKRGLFVLSQSGDSIMCANPASFEPKLF